MGIGIVERDNIDSINTSVLFVAVDRESAYKGIFIPMRFKVCLNSFYKPLQIVFPFL